MSSFLYSFDERYWQKELPKLFVVASSQRSPLADINVWIKSHNVAGVFLLGSSFSKASHVKSYVDFLQQGRELPLLVGVDQEGGRVRRIKRGILSLDAAAVYGESFSAGYMYRLGKQLGDELQALGVNLCLGPSYDVDFSDSAKIIGDRSYSSNPYVVAKFASAFTLGLQSSGVYSVAKHFPGHGGTSTDSHLSLPTLDVSLAELWHDDLLPFRYAIRHDVSMVMIGHLFFPQIDVSYPASMSSFFIEDVLRIRMGFQGVVMTDDLNMKAITQRYSIEEACLRSLQAGVDLLLISQNSFVLDRCVEYLLEAMRQGQLSEELLRSKIHRVQFFQTARR
ncbi:MAG: beta-N-acetylhexosaminidase [bacterium]